MENTVATSQSDTNEDIATIPNSPEIGTCYNDEEVEETDTEDAGLIGELHPLNRDAKDAFHLLARRRNMDFYGYHCNFIRVNSTKASNLAGCFVFSLSKLPEFAPLGWRIGRGRTNLRNLGVDILLMVEGKGSDEIAGIS